MKWMRGKPIDVFGLPRIRRLERKLIGEYADLVGRSLDELRPETHAAVAKIAGLPDMIRGYEHVKERNVERYRAEAERLERELRGETPARVELPIVNA
jgi:indolepyruvate ferredoxin oxidoreductase